METQQKKEEILQRIDAQALADYIASHTCETAIPRHGGWIVGKNPRAKASVSVRMQNGRAVATDFNPSGPSGGKQGDVLDWIQWLEGGDFSRALEIAANLAAISISRPQAIKYTPGTQKPLKPRTVAQEMADKRNVARGIIARMRRSRILAELREGLQSEEWRQWLRLRCIDPKALEGVEGIGYWTSRHIDGDPRCADLRAAGIVLWPRSLVVWNADGFIKVIPMQSDGAREGAGRRHVTSKGVGSWRPADVDAAKPVILVEGETSALALRGAGLQAIPCKVYGGNGDFRFVEDLLKRGVKIIAGYDADNAGRGFAASLSEHFPQAKFGSIMHLWECGERPDGTPDKDPCGFMVANRNRTAQAVEELRMATELAQEKAETPKPKKRKGAAEKLEVINNYFEPWRYDIDFEECIAPDGRRFNKDGAVSECYNDLWHAGTCVALPNVKNALKAVVCDRKEKQIKGLQERIKALSAAYTDADAGAIARLCERMGFDEYETRRVHLWLYQICARCIIPGEKTDGMLTFVSPREGMKKTDFVDAVSYAVSAGRYPCAPQIFMRGNKDEQMKLCKYPVVNLDEIDKFHRKKDCSEVKALITQRGITERKPYDIDDANRPARAVYFATSNEKPIPAGEGDARRYWVVMLRCRVDTTTKEMESIIREAAHATWTKLDAHRAQYDPRTVVGKIWVETDEERAETIRRNAHHKASDGAAIALDVFARNAEMESQTVYYDDLLSAGTIAAATETGDLGVLGLPGIARHFTPIRASASQISRLIGQRLRRQSRRVNGRVQSGYTLRQIVEEFKDDEKDSETQETQKEDPFYE